MRDSYKQISRFTNLSPHPDQRLFNRFLERCRRKETNRVCFLFSSWTKLNCVKFILNRYPACRVDGFTIFHSLHFKILLKAESTVRVTSGQKSSTNCKTSKRMLNFVWNTWKYWRNETDGKILPVFAQVLWTLKFYFLLFPLEIVFGVNSGNYLCI